MNKNIDATKGSIYENILRLAWPIIVVNLVQVIYNFADTFWVSRLHNGTEAIAAVTITFSLVFVLISLAGGLAVATSTLSSQFFGAGEYNKVEDVAYTSMILMGGFSIVISIVGIAFNRKLLTLLNTPDNVMPYAIQYFNIMMGGMLFMFSFFLLSGVLRGIGDAYTPMVIGIVSGVLNVILDPLIMFGVGPFPALGIRGAAYATVISKGVVSIYLIYVLFKGKLHLKLKVKNIKMDMGIVKQLLKIGLPAGITQVVISMGSIVIMGRVNMFGDIAAAAHGIGQRLDSLLFMPAMGFNQAAAIAVGQNLGAGKRERAKLSGIYAIKITFYTLIAISGFLFVFPELFLRIFSNDQEVIALGIYYVRLLTVAFAFVGCRIVMNGIFQGAGAAFLSMVLSIVSLWGIRIPLAYLFSYTELGVKGLWLGVGVSFVISAFVMYIWFEKGTWMEKAIVRKERIK